MRGGDSQMDPQMRVGDAEREQAVAALQQYVSDGYLTLDEFSERSAAAYRARTRGELVGLTQDLAPREHRPPAPNPAMGGALGRISWTPVAIAVAVAVGLVVLAGVAMVLMMLGVMGGMGGMMG
jgi:hypothetical protein